MNPREWFRERILNAQDEKELDSNIENLELAFEELKNAEQTEENILRFERCDACFNYVKKVRSICDWLFDTLASSLQISSEDESSLPIMIIKENLEYDLYFCTFNATSSKITKVCKYLAEGQGISEQQTEIPFDIYPEKLDKLQPVINSEKENFILEGIYKNDLWYYYLADIIANWEEDKTSITNEFILEKIKKYDYNSYCCNVYEQLSDYLLTAQTE